MQVTATEFRKSLFPLLDRALRGESIEVTYKGSTLRLVPSSGSTKLSRARRQNALLCDPGAIVESDAILLAEIEARLRRDSGSE